MSVKLLVLSICLFLAWVACRANNDGPDLKVFRKKMMLAINDGHTTDSLYNYLDKLTKKTPLLLAYMGTLDALKAKHALNPYNKIVYLNASEKILRDAVADDPHNIEIRFMRFSIQHKVPHFLGYGKDLDADREEMVKQLDRKNYGSADKLLTINIIKFLIDSKRCTPNEDGDLHKQLVALQ